VDGDIDDSANKSPVATKLKFDLNVQKGNNDNEQESFSLGFHPADADSDSDSDKSDNNTPVVTKIRFNLISNSGDCDIQEEKASYDGKKREINNKRGILRNNNFSEVLSPHLPEMLEGKNSSKLPKKAKPTSSQRKNRFKRPQFSFATNKKSAVNTSTTSISSRGSTGSASTINTAASTVFDKEENDILHPKIIRPKRKKLFANLMQKESQLAAASGTKFSSTTAKSNVAAAHIHFIKYIHALAEKDDDFPNDTIELESIRNDIYRDMFTDDSNLTLKETTDPGFASSNSFSGKTVAIIRQDMMKDNLLRRDQIQAFWEGYTLQEIKVKALESRLESLRVQLNQSQRNIGASRRNFFQRTAGESSVNNKSGSWNIILPLEIDDDDDDDVDEEIAQSIMSRLNQDNARKKITDNAVLSRKLSIQFDDASVAEHSSSISCSTSVYDKKEKYDNASDKSTSNLNLSSEKREPYKLGNDNALDQITPTDDALKKRASRLGQFLRRSSTSGSINSTVVDKVSSAKTPDQERSALPLPSREDNFVENNKQLTGIGDEHTLKEDRAIKEKTLAQEMPKKNACLQDQGSRQSSTLDNNKSTDANELGPAETPDKEITFLPLSTDEGTNAGTNERPTNKEDRRPSLNAIQQKGNNNKSLKFAGKSTKSLSMKKLIDDHASLSPDAMRILQELISVEKKQKKLEKQLQLAGIKIADDIPYEEAKAEVGKISKRMAEIGSSDVTHPDKLVQSRLQKEYFTLEQRMEKYLNALTLSDEHQEMERRQEEDWENSNKDGNTAALRAILRHMPVEVKKMSEAELATTPTPNKGRISREMCKRFKRTNVLQTLRTDPSELERAHPSTLENMRVTGLTLTERRALHSYFAPMSVSWDKNKAEKMTERKWVWFR